MTTIYELHRKMTAHLFPVFSGEDERFLALALCGEAGELANLIKKMWRDGADLNEEVRDEIADVRIYLELLAKCFGIEGEKLETLGRAESENNDNNYREGDTHLVALALCTSVGRLAHTIEERWRADNLDFLGDVARVQLAIVWDHVDLMAGIFDIGGEKLYDRVESKLAKVVARRTK